MQAQKLGHLLQAGEGCLTGHGGGGKPRAATQPPGKRIRPLDASSPCFSASAHPCQRLACTSRILQGEVVLSLRPSLKRLPANPGAAHSPPGPLFSGWHACNHRPKRVGAAGGQPRQPRGSRGGWGGGLPRYGPCPHIVHTLLTRPDLGRLGASLACVARRGVTTAQFRTSTEARRSRSHPAVTPSMQAAHWPARARQAFAAAMPPALEQEGLLPRAAAPAARRALSTPLQVCRLVARARSVQRPRRAAALVLAAVVLLSVTAAGSAGLLHGAAHSVLRTVYYNTWDPSGVLNGRCAVLAGAVAQGSGTATCAQTGGLTRRHHAFHLPLWPDCWLEACSSSRARPAPFHS